MSGEVELPKTQPALFPDRCAICGVTRPGGRVAVTTLAVNSTAPLLRSFGPLCWIRMPACPDCRWRMRRGVWLRWLTFWGGLAVSIAIVVNLFGWHQHPGQRALWKATALVLWLPWVIWQFWFPLPLSLSIDRDTILYEFASSEYEEEFKRLNRIGKGDDSDSGYLDEPPHIVV